MSITDIQPNYTMNLRTRQPPNIHEEVQEEVSHIRLGGIFDKARRCEIAEQVHKKEVADGDFEHRLNDVSRALNDPSDPGYARYIACLGTFCATQTIQRLEATEMKSRQFKLLSQPHSYSDVVDACLGKLSQLVEENKIPDDIAKVFSNDSEANPFVHRLKVARDRLFGTVEDIMEELKDNRTVSEEKYREFCDRTKTVTSAFSSVVAGAPRNLLLQYLSERIIEAHDHISLLHSKYNLMKDEYGEARDCIQQTRNDMIGVAYDAMAYYEGALRGHKNFQAIDNNTRIASAQVGFQMMALQQVARTLKDGEAKRAVEKIAKNTVVALKTLNDKNFACKMKQDEIKRKIDECFHSQEWGSSYEMSHDETDEPDEPDDAVTKKPKTQQNRVRTRSMGLEESV